MISKLYINFLKKNNNINNKKKIHVEKAENHMIYIMSNSIFFHRMIYI